MHYTLIAKSLVNQLAIIQSLASAAWRDWYNFLFFQNGLQPFGTYSKITTFASTFDNTIAHLHLPLCVTSALKYTHRLDFTTGKRVTEKAELTSFFRLQSSSLGQRARRDEESMRDLAGHTCRVVAK